MDEFLEKIVQISRYPVTNAQYGAYINATDADAPRDWEAGHIPEGKENHPVVNVTWEDAMRFCAWLTETLKLGEKETVRLPTEAEWEFTAAGEGGRKYPWGNDDPTTQHANYGKNVGDTTPVDAYPKGVTPEGVYDLAGNVWEWCYDWYGPYAAEQQTDPRGPNKGDGRVLRGGAFLDDPYVVRGAFRHWSDPIYWNDYSGVRVVVSPLTLKPLNSEPAN